ncbi:Ribonuclease P protein subunit p21, partial [Frankliniella fusca]
IFNFQVKMKSKSGGKLFQGKESFQRMNFLYQAAHVATQSSIDGDVAAYYGNSMLQTAQKSVLKIEPEVKRDICKGCGNLLKPGISVKVRIRSGNVIWTCLLCGTVKRFPTKRGYKIWIEKKEACLEVIEIPNSSEDRNEPTSEKKKVKVPVSISSCLEDKSEDKYQKSTATFKDNT